MVADANGMYLLLQMQDAAGRIDGPVDLFPVDVRVNGKFAPYDEQTVSFMC